MQAAGFPTPKYAPDGTCVIKSTWRLRCAIRLFRRDVIKLRSPLARQTRVQSRKWMAADWHDLMISQWWCMMHADSSVWKLRIHVKFLFYTSSQTVKLQRLGLQSGPSVIVASFNVYQCQCRCFSDGVWG